MSTVNSTPAEKDAHSLENISTWIKKRKREEEGSIRTPSHREIVARSNQKMKRVIRHDSKPAEPVMICESHKPKKLCPREHHIYKNPANSSGRFVWQGPTGGAGSANPGSQVDVLACVEPMNGQPIMNNPKLRVGTWGW